MSNDLVSVIMPAYNSAKYIGEAIESVINQTYMNWELIIVNDCSTDETESVVFGYAQDDSRVRYVKNEKNKGALLTRIEGIKHASAEYIAFLDSDDIWRKDKMILQMKLMRDKQAILSYTGCCLIDEHSIPFGKVYQVSAQVSYAELLYKNCITCSSVIACKDIIEKAFKELPKIDDRLYHEDYVAWLSILKKYKVAVGINQPLTNHRVLRDSKSGNKFKSAKMQYKSLRLAHVNPIRAIYYFGFYAVNGVVKYRR